MQKPSARSRDSFNTRTFLAERILYTVLLSSLKQVTRINASYLLNSPSWTPKFNKRPGRLKDDLQYSCFMKPIRDTNSEPGLPVLFQPVIVKDIYTRVTQRKPQACSSFSFIGHKFSSKFVLSS